MKGGVRVAELSIGHKIKILRKGRKLSQQELADRLKTNRANISNYETNRRVPPLKELNKICEFFGVGIDYFGVVTKNDAYDLISRAKDIFTNENISKEDKEEVFFELMNLYNEIRAKGGR